MRVCHENKKLQSKLAAGLGRGLGNYKIPGELRLEGTLRVSFWGCISRVIAMAIRAGPRKGPWGILPLVTGTHVGSSPSLISLEPRSHPALSKPPFYTAGADLECQENAGDIKASPSTWDGVGFHVRNHRRCFLSASSWEKVDGCRRESRWPHPW